MPGIRCPHHCEGIGSRRCRDLLREPLMGAMAVVVAGVVTKETLEMSFVDNEKVVETLRSDSANEPLGKCVRGPEERLHDLGALGLEHFVEARHELGVAIANAVMSASARSPVTFRACWVTHAAFG